MNDERYFDDLDSLLRWTLRDLIPDQEPSMRTWRAIRAQIKARRELRRDRSWKSHPSAASFERLPHFEETVALLHLRMPVRI